MVGKVLAALEASGLAENTMVIFSADNGAETHAFERLETFGQWSSGEFRGVKRDIYEGGHRVPFIVRWPGQIEAGAVSDEVVSQVDLAATFATMINYPIAKEEAIDSYNLLPVLHGEEYARPLRTATVQNTSAGKFALRQGDWVLIDAPSGSARAESKSYLQHFGLEDYGKDNPSLLFNLKNDPGQSKNLYAKHPEKVESMRTLLKRYVDGEPCAPNKD
jgi:arylsulfatase A-like enzyme